VFISVINIGDLDGSHVVMLFSKWPKVINGSPKNQLSGFSHVHTISNKSIETSILVYPCEHFNIACERGKNYYPWAITF
jgi:hypothetical protein